MSFQVCYVVQALDDGTFLGVRNGERRYFVSFEDALRFTSLNQALENARDIDSVSTHSRPKAAGQITIAQFEFKTFQLTAARRRLVKSGYVGS